MIAKRVEAPKSTPTFLGIANYIADAAKQKDLPVEMRVNDQVGNLVSYMSERKGAVVRVTNCNFDNTDLAIKEIQSIQSQNTRSKREKTYHLVVSLAEGEQPSADILREIEDDIVDHIGLGDHQRISAVHTNTDSWHIHIAINKVHPISYRNVEPYFDHFKLREKCQELEIRFGLQQTNGISPVRKPRMNKAQESENFTGVESLATWITENVADSIKEMLQSPGATWKGLHKILNKNGLMLRPRGAGFVFQDIQSGQTVKASTVDRGFSKKGIEKILGPFEEQRVQHTADKSYNAEPRQTQSKERDDLWSRYSQEKQDIQERRTDLFKALRESRKAYLYRALTDIKNRKKEAYQSAILNHRQKKQVLASLQIERIKVLEKAKDFWQKHKAEIDSQHPYCSWTTFLQNQVKQGNEAALGLLRQKGNDELAARGLMEAFNRENEQIAVLKTQKFDNLLVKEREELREAIQENKADPVVIREKFNQLKEQAEIKYAPISLQRYLLREARRGNQAAIALVGGASEGGNRNFIDRPEVDHHISEHLSFNVDMKGKINYKMNGNRIVDTGKRIFPESEDKQVLLASIQLAMGKYGSNLTVKGNEHFINKVKQIAKTSGLYLKINGEQINSREEILRDRFTGELIGHGQAPYQNVKNNKLSYFVTIKNSYGENTYWGVDFVRALSESGCKKGEVVKLTNLGKTNVIIKEIINGGKEVEREVYRNAWKIEPYRSVEKMKDNEKGRGESEKEKRGKESKVVLPKRTNEGQER